MWVISENDLSGSLGEINEIFEKSSQNVKMAALLMEHYHEYDKTLLETVLNDSMDPVRTFARNTVEKNGLKMAADRPGREKMTPAEIEKNDLEYAKKGSGYCKYSENFKMNFSLNFFEFERNRSIFYLCPLYSYKI